MKSLNVRKCRPKLMGVVGVSALLVPMFAMGKTVKKGDHKVVPLAPAGSVETPEDEPSNNPTLGVKRPRYAQNEEPTSSTLQPATPPEPPVVTPANTGGSDTKVEGEDEGSELADTWASYSDLPEELAADDVSRRIRVEDIVEPPSEYHYAAFGRGDPFVPPVIAQEINSIELPIVSPLQRHPLSAMGLTGVWGGDEAQRKALVTVNDFNRGTIGVVVKVGDPIGNSGGKVVAINKEGMTVREFSLAPDGSRVYEDRFLMLGDKPPIPSVSGNVVLRPGTKGGTVVDPIDRANATGIMVDPEGPVFDQLWRAVPPPSSLKKDGNQPARPQASVQGGNTAPVGSGATTQTNPVNPGVPAVPGAPLTTMPTNNSVPALPGQTGQPTVATPTGVVMPSTNGATVAPLPATPDQINAAEPGAM